MSQSGKVTKQSEAIMKVLNTLEQGASIEEIKVATGIDIELRTLQRRLAELKKLGFVKTSGDKRSTRYHYAMPHLKVSEPNVLYEPQPERNFMLSEEGREIQSLLQLPVLRHKPVGYNREFLERYRPNIDSYLTLPEKQKLAAMGRTSTEDKPAGTYAKEILSRLLIDLSWNSSRLEGNTYSILETERLILQGQAANNKSVREAQMILNHKDAIEFLVKGDSEIGFNRYTILNLHGLLSYELLSDLESSGKLRTTAVGISHCAYTPLAIPQLIEAMFEMMLEKAVQIKDPFEQAFFITVHLPYLQPFEDVNKRVSRLAANIPLNHHNLSPISFLDVPKEYYTQGLMGVYELNRTALLKDVFLWAYERSAYHYAMVRQTVGDPDPFRVKYQQQVRSLVTEIISKGFTREMAIVSINDRSLQLPSTDQAKFIEVVETTLMSLHEGNIARFRITPAEFRKWKDGWDL